MQSCGVIGQLETLGEKIRTMTQHLAAGEVESLHHAYNERSAEILNATYLV
jgi:hypothetical protein